MPGRGRFDRRNVIWIGRVPVHSGRQTIHIISRVKPSFAGVDPYNFYIDRNSSDNVAAVT